MKISERIEGTIENWRAKWGDALKGWMSGWLSFGIELFFDVLGKAAQPSLKPLIDTLEATGKVPPEIKPLLDELKEPKGEVAALFGYSAGNALIGGALGKIIDAIFLPLAYAVNSVTSNVILNPSQLLGLKWRGAISRETVDQYLSWLGYNDEDIGHWHELSKVIPPLPDMVRFADFSAFDPQVIAKWRQFYDAPGWITDPMSLIGITNEEPRDWANKYWFSHWIQPGRYELGEIYRRGLLGTPLVGSDEVGGPGGEGEAEAAIKLAYRTMGYSAYWQDHLLQLVRSIPTRVDIRRWWDMRTIDESELRSLYQRQGYFGKDLENYVLWTKVYVAFPDLMARWSNGWITEVDVRSELTALGMPGDRVEEMIQTKKKSVEAGQMDEGKALTKSEIYKGVKKATLTRDEGIDLLMDLNYNLSQAEYLLDVNVGALEGSPETYDEFKDLTTKYKRAIGKEVALMPEELIKAGEVVVKLTGEVKALERAIKEEERGLIIGQPLPEAATKKRDELRVALHRAEAELTRVQTEYDGLVAEWKHGLP